MSTASEERAQSNAAGTTYTVLLSLSLCHLLNDTIQSLLPALYPVLRENYALSFTQIGFLHFTFYATASVLQPIVGFTTDRKPRFRLLPFGMSLSLAGLLTLAFAGGYALLVCAALFIGFGSAIFHPDASRLARAASGGKYGLAQSVFQVGGNAGSAIGPLLAAFVVLPLGQSSVALFSVLALLGIVVLWRVGNWARERYKRRSNRSSAIPSVPRNAVWIVAILALLIVSKYLYIASLTGFYTFFVIEKFGVSIQASQVLLFVFLGALAVGTLAGGPIGDRIGRKAVIWISILGVLPFTLALPYANLFWTATLTAIIGVVMAGAFSSILVYAQALMPGREGLVAGMFFGFAFGVAGVGAAGLGMLADLRGVSFVFQICGFLPFIGLLAAFLPPERT